MARPNIAAVAYRTRTICNTVKKNDYWYYYRGAPVTQGLGVTFCGTGTIDGELTVAYRKNAFVRTANQRSWWRYWPRQIGGERRNNRNNESFSRCRPLRFDTNTMLMQRCENINKIRLTRTTIQHNGEAGMRDNDLHRQRLQQRTGGLALVGLEKGELFVLKKTVGFALIKADCFALKKAEWFVFKKTVFSPSKRWFLSLWKKRIFRSLNGRLRASRSVCYNSNRRVTNVGRMIPNN